MQSFKEICSALPLGAEGPGEAGRAWREQAGCGQAAAVNQVVTTETSNWTEATCSRWRGKSEELRGGGFGRTHSRLGTSGPMGAKESGHGSGLNNWPADDAVRGDGTQEHEGGHACISFLWLL